ncbi:Uncharacterised protein [Moraxella lacunata]|uniref:Uncharacterized protein n=1 Tax=Moraxella lacunata TaxID=477 RepID=A0A378QEF6_MORLA|nr:hypothetical protein [Moraxella lacunata]STY99081.1 Uncharacterised protein [Moraxella lacunata]
MKPKQADNGASPIIDALLIRMSELDRFSDDERVIAGRELLPLDVVVNKHSEFGLVHLAKEYKNGNGLTWLSCLVGEIGIIFPNFEHGIRTIYETEGVAARAYLVKHFGDKKWF